MKTEAHWERHWIGQILGEWASSLPWTELTEVQWEALAGASRDERLAPLLYYTFQESGWPPTAPPSFRLALRQAYYSTGGTNLMLYEELARVLEVLAPHPVIVLKGASLASTLYPNIALRPMCDVDLLLGRDHIESSVAALRRLGYRETSPEMSAGLSDRVHYHVALHGGPGGKAAFELHWRLVAGEADWRSPRTEWFWSEAEDWRLGSPGSRPLRALQLKPTANLLYLAAHSALQHGAAQARLGWIHDVHCLVRARGQEIDWKRLRDKSREFRWTPALAVTLESAQMFFGTPLPERYLSSLDEVRDRPAERLVESMASPWPSRGFGVWLELRSLDGRGRLRLARAILWPSPEYIRWRYSPRPRWLWPLCYPYRWAMVLKEALRTLARLATKRARGARSAPHGGAQG